MFTDPVKNLKAFGLRDDSIVADLGAGTGYYTLALGTLVPRGKIYAVEISKDFLTTIKNKVEEARFSNVEILWGDVERPGGTKLGDGILDAVVASNILFQVEDKNKFIEEIKRILKPGGKVLVVDWSTEPAPDSVFPVVNLKGAIPAEKARGLFEFKGFTLEREIDAGAHHYGMILKKSQAK